jgi:hypothetical protein
MPCGSCEEKSSLKSVNSNDNSSVALGVLLGLFGLGFLIVMAQKQRGK